MQIALLGASGFVGAAILRRLAAAGHLLKTVSRTPPAARDGWLCLDLAQDEGDLRGHLEGCEVLVDAAALTGYAAVPPDDLESLKRINLGIPVRVGRELPASVRRIVYLSTIDVYAHPPALPLTEDSPTEPATNYARTKRLAEHAYANLAAERGIELVILRLSQVYGPGDRSPKLVPAFIRAAVRDGKLPRLDGTGTELRDLVHVDDVAAAAECALAGPPGTYNVATGRSLPVSEVPRILSALTGLPEGGCGGSATGKPSYSFDISRIRRDLGFEPAISLEQGLRNTLEWMQGQSSS